MNWDWLALVAVVFSTALGQLLYKLYFLNRSIFKLGLAIVFFVTASLCAFLALRSIDIGMVYMSTAFTQILIVTLSHYFLKEKLTPEHRIAMILIVSGVIIYALPI